VRCLFLGLAAMPDLDLGELFGVGFGHSCGDAQYFRQPVKGNDAIGWRLSLDDGDRLQPEFRLRTNNGLKRKIGNENRSKRHDGS